MALDSTGQESVNGSMPTSPYTAHQAPTTAVDPFAALTQSFIPKRAVSYLRVSTREQAERGGREEGFSIPAQREANKKKAQSMGAMVVKEFVERGVSGTSTNRPALQEMLRYLETEQYSIDYLIVHKVDRLARNRADDVALNARFDEYGVRLVSTSENIDQTPGGLLLHGIMSSIAEFYSKNLSNEVKKGMDEKVRSGGSVGRAPIGYLNVREVHEGREVRTVEVDPIRAPLVTWAFEQYATGSYSVRSLTTDLITRGLTMLPTAKLPEKAVETRQVHQILTNPYYLGLVVYKGAHHPGNHDALVDPETFEKVQRILKSKINGERNRQLPHYLKSTLYCGQCDMRMIVQVAKARTGDEYPYYSCLGRHSKRTTCDLRSISIVNVEDLIQELYDRLALQPSHADSLRQVLLAELRTFTKDADRQREALHTQKLEIERKQRKLLEAHYNDAIPIDMLRTEQHSLDSALNNVTRQLDALNTDLDDNTRLIERAIDLAQHSADAYRRAPDQIRRLLNQVLFDRLKVTMTDEDEHRLEAIVAAPFAELLSVGIRGRTVAESPRENEELPASAGGEFPWFQSVSAARVSNTSTMVGLTRFELATP
ncbi:recombinase family protein [Pseudoclavibacter helvolus]|uniref:recombinase family protein n=1 Tax=Pseudoclavibacter helvolus TaxID=255205 RepID=UPI0024AD060F|nr:recombinase family protein [Pseudoclavibacter helvolus]